MPTNLLQPLSNMSLTVVPGWKWCKLAALGPARDAFWESRRLSSALKADERLDLGGMPNEGAAIECSGAGTCVTSSEGSKLLWVSLSLLPAALAAQLGELDDTQRRNGPTYLYAALVAAPAAWWAAAAEAGLITCELADSLGEAAVREGVKQAAMSAYRNAAFIALCTAAGADHGVLLALRDSRDYRSYSWMTSLVIEILVKARATKGAPLELDGLEAAFG